MKSVSKAYQLGITLQVVGNKSVESLAEREEFYYRRYLQVPMNTTLPA
jgi:hypothetical protein